MQHLFKGISTVLQRHKKARETFVALKLADFLLSMA